MEKKRTIFQSTQSVVNWNQWGWIVWLKFDRITDDQQWQQTRNRAPYFDQTKPRSGLNVVQCGQDNGSLLILLEFILKPQLFFQCFALILKRGSDTMRVEFWVLECSRVGLPCLCLISCSRRTTLKRDQQVEAFKGPLGCQWQCFVLEISVLNCNCCATWEVCSARCRSRCMRTYVLVYTCFLCMSGVWSFCMHCASVKIAVINQVTKYQIGFFPFFFFIEQEQI